MITQNNYNSVGRIKEKLYQNRPRTDLTFFQSFVNNATKSDTSYDTTLYFSHDTVPLIPNAYFFSLFTYSAVYYTVQCICILHIHILTFSGSILCNVYCVAIILYFHHRMGT